MKRIISSFITLAILLCTMMLQTTATPRWNGDANGDSKINLADVSLILRYIAEWNVKIDPVADFDENGNIDLADVTLILKHIAKWNVAPDSLLEAEYGVSEIDFDVPEPITTEIVKGSDFGFDTDAVDNSRAWAKAVSYLCEHPGTTLEIETGVYKMAGGVSFDGLNNCIVDGGGSTFLFSKMNFFTVGGNTDLFTVKNLTIDWDYETAGYPTSSVVRIKDIRDTEDPAIKNVDFEFFLVDDASYALTQPWNSMMHMDPDTLTIGMVNGKGTIHTLEGDFTSRDLTAPNVITSTIYYDSFEVGDVWLMRHYNYSHGAFRQTDATNVTYRDINIYSGPGGGIYLNGAGVHHVRIDGVTIGLNPENDDTIRMSTTADALNFKNTGGYIIVENCDVGFQGDDCINVHSTPGMVKYAEDNTLEVVLRNGVNFYSGCEIGFKDAISFDEDDFTATVLDVVCTNNDIYKLTLDKDIPDYITDSYKFEWVIYNKSNNGENIIIRNNYFHEAHSHGIVLRCSNALVENNRFYKLYYGAINVSLDYGYLWIEGAGLHNVIIRGNTFRENDLMEGYGQLAFLCKTDTYEFNSIMGSPFKDVLISGNTFINPRGTAIEVINATNVSIVNNSIINPDPLKLYTGTQESYKQRGRISFGNSMIKNVTVIHNKWEESPYISDDAHIIKGYSYVKDKEKTVYSNSIITTSK